MTNLCSRPIKRHLRFKSRQVIESCSSFLVNHIRSQFLVPSAKVFAVRDTIPFHIQVTGPVDAVRNLVTPPYDPSSKNKSLCLYVTIERRIAVNLEGNVGQKVRTIGRTVPRSIPPPLESPHVFSFTTCSAPRPVALGNGSSPTISVDWEGEVSLNPDIESGGFIIPSMSVRDSMDLWILPTCSKYQTLRISVPILLVSDTWSYNLL